MAIGGSLDKVVLGLPVAVKRTAFLAVLCLLAVFVAGCSAPAATEAPDEGDIVAEVSAQPFEPDAGTRFEVPYYTIEVPESWVGETSFVYQHDYNTPSPGLGLGYSSSVQARATGMTTFGVTCFTDTWGTQGTFYSMRVGSTPLLEGSYVSVHSAMFDQDQNRLPDNIEEYASYVSVKQEAADGGRQTIELPYYSFDLSAPEASEWTFTYDGAHCIEGDEGIGYSLDVSDRQTGTHLFFVVCATGGFAPAEGDELAIDVGAPVAWPQARVYVAQQRFGTDGEAPAGDLAAYARYVTAK